MNTIKVNGNKAIVIEGGNISIPEEHIKIEYANPRVALYIYNDIICVDTEADEISLVSKKIAESLVGENGEITFYNPKEKTLSVKRVGDSTSRSASLTKKLTNK